MTIKHNKIELSVSLNSNIFSKKFNFLYKAAISINGIQEMLSHF